MKRKIFWLLVVMAVVMFGIGVLNGMAQDEEFPDDNYGVVKGELIDADTHERVREVFGIEFHPPEDFIPGTKNECSTDKNGVFSIKQRPGKYVLRSFPFYKSEYSMEPFPHYFPEIIQEIVVEKGKITKVFKKVYRAGKLKIVIVDRAGTKMNPKEYFDSVCIGVQFERPLPKGGSDFLIDSNLFSESGSLKEGELLTSNLYPCTYHFGIEFFFSTLGYGSKRYENIQIEKGKTTELKVVLDLNDRTGVYGKIVDQLGTPVEKVDVRIWELDKEDRLDIHATMKTDSSGNYRIIGLSEGTYRISFDKDLFPLKSLTAPDETVFIKTGKMIEMNREVKKR